jgi:hypothetical protein
MRLCQILHKYYSQSGLGEATKAGVENAQPMAKKNVYPAYAHAAKTRLSAMGETMCYALVGSKVPPSGGGRVEKVDGGYVRGAREPEATIGRRR